jgi:hypothetical protein
MKQQEAIQVKVDKDGYCPVLKPGEWCQEFHTKTDGISGVDIISQLFHFKTPDGVLICCNEKVDKDQEVKIGKDGLPTILRMPFGVFRGGAEKEFACWPGSLIKGVWKW